MKGCVFDRSNRTIKNKMRKEFTAHNTTVYIKNGLLKKVIDENIIIATMVALG